VDTSSLKSKGFFDLPNIEFDYLVTMVGKEVCPTYPSKKSLDWNLYDIKDRDISEIRELRDKIKDLIEKIVEEEFKK